MFPKFYNGAIFKDPFTEEDFSKLLKGIASAMSQYLQPFSEAVIDEYVKPINGSYVLPDMKTFSILDSNPTTLNMGGVEGKYTKKVRAGFLLSGTI